MTHTAELLKTFPARISLDRQLLARCIDACLDCPQACTGCADADLAEETVAHLRKCIRTCLDCADISETTARVLSRQTGYDARRVRVLRSSSFREAPRRQAP
jgi:hypothetical protein